MPHPIKVELLLNGSGVNSSSGTLCLFIRSDSSNSESLSPLACLAINVILQGGEVLPAARRAPEFQLY